MKNFSQPTENKDSASFARKRAVFLGIVIVLVAAVVALSLYTALNSAFGNSDPGAVSSTEDGKLVIEDLYEGEITIPDFDIAHNTYDTEKFQNDNGLITYDDPNASLGIDVSDYQGEIDWETVKESGIDFAMIRAGYRGATRGSLYEDESFERNYEGATNAGIQVGVYFFSQATSVAEAEEEASYVLGLLQGKDLAYPVVFDWEFTEVEGSRTTSATGEQITSYASAFCKKISKAGYTAGVYFNRSLGYNYYNLEELRDLTSGLPNTRTFRPSTTISSSGSIPTTRRCRASARRSTSTSALKSTRNKTAVPGNIPGAQRFFAAVSGHFVPEPAALLHVDAAVRKKRDALRLEETALDVRAAEDVAGAERAVLKHDAVARRADRVRVAVQHEADAARGTRLAGHKGNAAVIRDLAARDFLHGKVDVFRKIIHAIAPFRKEYRSLSV